MGLVHAEKILRPPAELLRHATAVFPDVGRIVTRAESAVQPGVNPAGHAALAGEEGMAKSGDRRQQRRGEHHLLSAGASLRPGNSSICGSETPSTLNIEPMPPR